MRVITDKDGYQVITSATSKDEEPELYPVVSLDFESYGMSIAVQKRMWDAGFIMPSHWYERAGVYQTLAGALRSEGLSADEAKAKAHSIIDDVRSDYR